MLWRKLYAIFNLLTLWIIGKSNYGLQEGHDGGCNIYIIVNWQKENMARHSQTSCWPPAAPRKDGVYGGDEEADRWERERESGREDGRMRRKSKRRRRRRRGGGDVQGVRGGKRVSVRSRLSLFCRSSMRTCQSLVPINEEWTLVDLSIEVLKMERNHCLTSWRNGTYHSYDTSFEKRERKCVDKQTKGSNRCLCESAGRGEVGWERGRPNTAINQG